MIFPDFTLFKRVLDAKDDMYTFVSPFSLATTKDFGKSSVVSVTLPFFCAIAKNPLV